MFNVEGQTLKVECSVILSAPATSQSVSKDEKLNVLSPRVNTVKLELY